MAELKIRGTREETRRGRRTKRSGERLTKMAGLCRNETMGNGEKLMAGDIWDSRVR